MRTIFLCRACRARWVMQLARRHSSVSVRTDHLPRFCQAVHDEPNELFRDFVWLALMTGQRRANVLAMTWQEVDFTRREWRIPDTKNGTPHTVPLPAQALEILSRRAQGTDGRYVFPGSGRSGHLVEPLKSWKRFVNRAGLDNFRIHDLRHTLASWQAGTGASLPIIGKTLNHKSAASTQGYMHLFIDPVRQAMGLAVDAMLAAGAASEAEEVCAAH